MTEFATKDDFNKLQSEIIEQRKVTQDLITEVAKGGQKLDSFLMFQTGLNVDLRAVIKEANEATCGKIKELKHDHTVRLNKHSEELKSNAEDRSQIKEDQATLKESTKNQTKNISFIVSGIGAIITIAINYFLRKLGG